MIHESLITVINNLNNLYTTLPWFRALTIIIGSLILAKITTYLFEKIIPSLTSKTNYDFDDLLVEKTETPIWLLIISAGVYFATVETIPNNNLLNIIETFIAIFSLYLIGSIIYVLLDTWGERLAKKTKTKVQDTIVPLTQKASGVLFFLIAVLWTLQIWNIDLTPYLAGLGIAGVIIGMAFQDILKNTLGGISLVLDKNVNIGEVIETEDGTFGEIQDIGLRSTKITTFDNETVFVPNGLLANSKVQNYMRPTERSRITVDFGIGYGSDVDKAREIVLDTMKNIEDISDNPYMDVVFKEMGDSALILQARAFVDDFRISRPKKWEATEKIYKNLTEAGINIPFPQRTVHMKKEED